MTKKRGIFKEFQSAYRINSAVALSGLWVAAMPSVGSLICIPLLVQRVDLIRSLDFYTPEVALPYLLFTAFFMGLALMPTTLVAVLSGFFFGWEIFPVLFLAYNIAALTGYGWGRKMSGNSLNMLLERYPKAKKLIVSKENRMGELVLYSRLSPVLPFAISNLIFALLEIGWKRLLVFGSIGMLPRTLLSFWSGVLGSDIQAAIGQESLSGKGWIFIIFLVFSIWGIWTVFRKNKT